MDLLAPLTGTAVAVGITYLTCVRPVWRGRVRGDVVSGRERGLFEVELVAARQERDRLRAADAPGR